MSIKVIVFSSEAGGAEALIPVCRLLGERPGFELEIWSSKFATHRFERAALPFRSVDAADTAELLQALVPDLVITSATNVPELDRSELDLWANCRKFGIPTLAFLDQWQNYSRRFFGRGPRDDTVLPDFINCINELGEREMVEEGFPRARLVKFGQPYLDWIATQRSATDGPAVRRRMGYGAHDRIATFISEPISVFHGRDFGYDEFDALDVFFELVRRDGSFDRAIVKLHPKDQHDRFQKRCRDLDGIDVALIDKELTPLECVAVSDILMGMSSILLIEAFMLEKPVLALQPGLSAVDPLVLTRHGLIPVVRDRQSLPLPIPMTARPPTDLDVTFQRAELVSFISSLTERMRG